MALEKPLLVLLIVIKDDFAHLLSSVSFLLAADSPFHSGSPLDTIDSNVRQGIESILSDRLANMITMEWPNNESKQSQFVV